ncbi:YcnI family copper-binding membrane protein [Microlunatus ginsengisoli]|uniref:YncI copper-binding domain-containing protein n=1 Tax=Microlunatus ginsengisoli TaxID=363863 RepID=A0ABP6ZY48_9ACTN
MSASPRVRPAARTAAAVLLAGGLLLAAATPAGAHVHVEADDAVAGGFSVLTFRVPNESDTAGTVAVAVTLPTETPFLYVSSKPVPGWSVSAPKETLPKPVDYEGTTITKAVRTVTWTAANRTRIGPGEFGEFELSVGPLPDPGTIVVPVAQTYSDGKVVRWDQPTPASGDEPERPAPTFEVAAAAADDHHDPGTPASASASPVESDHGSAADAGSGGDPAARVLGGAGLLLGAAALVVAVSSRRRAGSGGPRGTA